MARLEEELGKLEAVLIKSGEQYELFTTLEKLGIVDIVMEMYVFNDYISAVIREPK
jgi:hypothetical protein